MKRVFIAVIGMILTLGAGLFAAPSAWAQASQNDVAGLWLGSLSVNTVQLRLLFEIKKKGDSYSGVLTSIDQGRAVIPCSTVTFADGKAKFAITPLSAAFEGTLSKDGKTLTGNWTQGGTSFPLTLARTDKAPTVNRPQEPKPPYPYRSEEVTYPSAQAGVTIAGTLTLPSGNGPFPVALMITGSGPQDRNEEILGHKPFLVIADYLTRHGIAVLRSDDRGIGKSTGKFDGATSADFAQDVRGGIAYVKTRKEIDPKKIGLIGHSEGGLIAPLVAADSKDVAFVVLMAGPGVPGDEILLEQSALIARAVGAPEPAITMGHDLMASAFSIVKAEPDDARAKKKMNEALALAIAKLPEDERKVLSDKESDMEKEFGTFATPWFRYFLTYDPRTSLRKVTCTVLALNGEKDLQVPPKQNLPEIEKALKAAGNTRVTIKELPGLNHLFQPAQTGSPAEYNSIETTVAPVALETMSDWILSVTK